MPCDENECKCKATQSQLIAAGLKLFGDCENPKCGHPVLNHTDADQPGEAKFEFFEVPPSDLNGNSLFERDDAAVQIADCFLGSSGVSVTPIMDHCYGAGKTSLAWKFRRLLTSVPQAKQATWDTAKCERLSKATYLHVPFKRNLLTNEFLTKFENGTLTSADYDSVICSRIQSVLELSCHRPVPKFSSRLDLQQFFTKEAASVSFLFHFDEVGALEFVGAGELSAKLFYRMWNVLDAFRAQHFSIFSGRSAVLQMCKRQLFQDVDFSSPNTLKLINLNPLSLPGIVAVFNERKLDHCSQWIQQHGKALQALTGGIPRAVSTVLDVVATKQDALSAGNPLSPDHSDILLALKTHCPNLFVNVNDQATMRLLVEMSWAGIDFSMSSSTLNGEPMSAVLARLGVFSTAAPAGLDRRLIVVPLFQVASQAFSPRSLLSIGEYLEPGPRLEVGFRRVLHLRMSLGNITSWVDVGLPYLNAKVPFPQIGLNNYYAFPKIVSSGLATKAQAKATMEAIHSHAWENWDDAKRQTFQSSMLPSLYSEMRIGQYYTPVLMSGSSDALIPAKPKTMVGFQFKNSDHQFTLEEARAEAQKCAVVGWQNFLVIICSAGCERECTINVKAGTAQVSVVLLSKKSVERFLGKTALEAIAPGDSQLADCIRKMSVVTPVTVELFRRVY